MALTKLGYLRYAEPVEALYMNCSTQLIINIARHFLTGKGLSTAEWQLKKLSELQSLTSESIEIIAANTGRSHDEVARAFREVMGVGLADAEKVLAAASKAGYLPPVPPIEDSVAMRNILQTYIAQADDTLNLVNTVMLQSTLDRYRYIIDDIVRIERLQGITAGSDLVTQLARTQGVLNTATANVVIGAESRTKALRDAIKQLSAQGITGWVDRGGHRWTAEAYVNMDIRTTVHNVAIEAQKERSAEYGVSTFQISTHSGARPLCAPYQGWICSWDNSAGTVTDLWGVVYQVHPINETSYGEAAGIFGINCGHFPETFVDGFSVPRYNELTPEDEAKNAIEYAQSQQQREIEREIRQAKTDAAALDAMGDKEGFKEAAAKVKEKQNEYKQFCESTGRTPRLDRTQVSSYNRSTASKANAAAKKYTVQDRKTVNAISGGRITNRYGTPAEKHAERYYGLVRSMKTDVETIAKNTGFSRKDIASIKNYIFIETHDLGDGRVSRFDPDFAMAQSWQRLISGKYYPHDLTLLRHELYERDLISKGIAQREAHIIASEKYNYDKEADAFYGAIKTNRNKG